MTYKEADRKRTHPFLVPATDGEPYFIVGTDGYFSYVVVTAASGCHPPTIRYERPPEFGHCIHASVIGILSEWKDYLSVAETIIWMPRDQIIPSRRNYYSGASSNHNHPTYPSSLKIEDTFSHRSKASKLLFACQAALHGGPEAEGGDTIK